MTLKFRRSNQKENVRDKELGRGQRRTTEGSRKPKLDKPAIRILSTRRARA